MLSGVDTSADVAVIANWFADKPDLLSSLATINSRFNNGNTESGIENSINVNQLTVSNRLQGTTGNLQVSDSIFAALLGVFSRGSERKISSEENSEDKYAQEDSNNSRSEIKMIKGIDDLINRVLSLDIDTEQFKVLVSFVNYASGFLQYNEERAAHWYIRLLVKMNALPSQTKYSEFHLGFNLIKPLVLGNLDWPSVRANIQRYCDVNLTDPPDIMIFHGFIQNYNLVASTVLWKRMLNVKTDIELLTSIKKFS